jgi:uncharacterized protein (DUF488 family)
VIDVRFRPQSRKPGMSKTRLGEMLAGHRIAYEHRRELGTPAELRALYRANKVEQAAAAYRSHVESTAADALDRLAEEVAAGGPRTALLCLEEEPSCCHRRVLTEALRERRPGLRVVDL